MKKKLLLLSNITVDLIIGKLRKKYEVYTPSGYDAWISGILNDGSDIYSQTYDAVFLLLDGTECRSWNDAEMAWLRMDLWKHALDQLVARISNVPVFVSTIDIRMNRISVLSEASCALQLENDWYEHLSDCVRDHQNVFFYELKDRIMDCGRQTFYSDKMWYLGGMPFAREGIGQIADDIDCLIENYYRAPKKVIVCDLDNTLWGGVIGEDGLDGIQLSNHKEGQRYYDFQRQLLEMKNRGALLAINSKNNIDDVKQVFDEHPYMLLKWEDFVSKKINWNNKAVNIKEMVAELNLSESAFVFVDDNPIEREIVQGECPEVLVLDFPEDTTKLIDFAEQFYQQYFRQPHVSGEDAKKTEMYFAEEKRRGEKNSALNFDDYISKLEMEVDIHLMNENECARVTQLCNKTNQFNVTTKRYSEKDIKELSDSSDADVFVAYTKDKYGEDGLVAVLIAKKETGAVNIDTFLMSCRVMGRKLETVMINLIMEYYKACDNVSKVYAHYLPTAKNVPVAGLFDDLGFDVISESDSSKEYILNLKDWEKDGTDVYKRVSFKTK